MNARTAKLLHRYTAHVAGKSPTGAALRSAKRLWLSIPRPSRGKLRTLLQERLA